MIIYKITNTINNKIYIGQTTKTFEERMNGHKNSVKTKGRKPTPLIKAIRKYGWDSFSKEIIEFCDNIDELNSREIYWICYYSSLIDFGKGYNLKLGGANSGSHSKYTRKLISDSQKGELNHMYNKKGSLSKTSKKVIDMDTMEIYDNATQFAEKYNLSLSKVCSVCRGERASVGGHYVKYIDDCGNPILDETHKAKRRFSKRVRNVETGEIFCSLKSVGLRYNLLPSNLGYILNNDLNKERTFAGFHWEYIGNESY